MESNQHIQGSPSNHEHDTIDIYTQGITFRADALRYQRKKTFLGLITTLQWQAIIASIFLMLIDVGNNNNPLNKHTYLPLFIQMCIYASVLTILAILNYKILNPAFTSSVLISALYLIALTILYGFHYDIQLIASVIYTSLLMVISFIWFKNTRNIILLGLVCVQFNLIVAKLDGKFDLSWPIILFILMLICSSNGLIGLVLTILGIHQRISAPRFKLQSIGLMYMGLILFCFSLDAALILSKLLFQVKIYPIAIPCAVFHLLLILFIAKYKDQICLFKSNGVQINASQQQEQAIYEKIMQSKRFIMLSENWFSCKEKQESRQSAIMETQLVIQTVEKIEPVTQCVVCLSQQATLIWMPCGHMTICQTCGNHLMKNGRVKCLLCKKNGEQIYHIFQALCKFDKKQYVSDFFYKIKANLST